MDDQGGLLAFEKDASGLRTSPNRQIPLCHITSRAVLLENEERTAELLQESDQEQATRRIQ